MPVPLAPYPTSPNGGQSQLVCSGCRNLLLYPLGATTVCCAVCNSVTPVHPPGSEMAQLVCGFCHTLLMYTTRSHQRTMLLLSHGQSGSYSKSNGTCQLWELQDVVDVPIWSKICQVCSLQFCDTCCGFSNQ